MRRTLGGLRIAAGGILLFSFIFQIVDLAVHGSLIPNEYFAFFTVESTMLNIVLLFASGISAVRKPRDSVLLTSLAMAIVPYAIVTGLVYNLLLRNIPPDKYLGMDWHNEVFHVVIPLFLTIDWFVLRLRDSGRARLGFGAIGVAFVYPVAWIVFSMVRGAITGWYPYPFLDPTGAAGVGGVVGYIIGLSVFIALLAAAAILVTRRQRRATASAPGGV